MEDWEVKFNGISIHYMERMVQIKTDSPLRGYLAKPGNGSLELAEHIKGRYHEIFAKELNITKESLSVEILVHVYLDEFSHVMEKCSVVLPKPVMEKLVSCMHEIEGHTQIIDSGEREVDSNRHVFDALVPYREVLYHILGKNA